MITAHKKNHGARIPLPVKKAIALESLSKKQTVVNISRRGTRLRRDDCVNITQIYFSKHANLLRLFSVSTVRLHEIQNENNKHLRIYQIKRQKVTF